MTKKNLTPYLMSLLSRREYSRKELENKLLRLTDNHDEIHSLLNQFSQNNWQSDSRFSESFIYSKKRKYGVLKLKEELKQHQISEQDCLSFLPSFEEQIDIAVSLLRKRCFNNTIDLKEKQKQFRYLQQKGFPTEVIYASFEQLEQN